MKNDNVKILAIETSCDETAAAVISGCHPEHTRQTQCKLREGSISGSRIKYGMTSGCRPVILSNVVSSQIDLHTKTGGVVPEVASRAHLEAIIPVIEEALARANSKFQIPNSKLPISNETMKQLSNDELSLITHIAVTAGPGLIGSLLVGFNTAKSMAYALGLPIIPINHIEGHIYSAVGGARYNNQDTITKQIASSAITGEAIPNLSAQGGSTLCGKFQKNNEAMKQLNNEPEFPILALTVSGGHTSLTLMHDHGEYQTIGQTRDDAAGEAFDKVAKLLDLGYPGGPIVSKLAEDYRRKIPNSKFQIPNYKAPNEANKASKAIVLPRPMIRDKNFDFSFSGLKTAALDVVREIENQNVIARSEGDPSLLSGQAPQSNPKKIATAEDSLAMTDYVKLSNNQKAEICAAFEDAAVDVLVTKTLRAVGKYQPKTVILAGGVAANKRLREELASRLLNYKLQITNYKQNKGHSEPIRKSQGKLREESQDGEILRSAQDDNLAMKQFNNVNFWAAPKNLCGDNAAMIGLAAYYHIVRGDISNWNEIKVDSNMKL